MKRAIRLCLGCGVAGAVILVAAQCWVVAHAQMSFSSLDDVGEADVALVFGGGMKGDGVTMSDLQTERVDAAVALYQAGKVTRLVMTGDDGQNRVNEVDAMMAHAIAAGVPTSSVSTDPHGYNTYSSCYRARHEYALQTGEVIAVSQRFHLRRIAYICNSFGIAVTPFEADRGPYGFWGAVWGMHVREYLARLKAVWQVEVTHPPPIELN